MSKHPLSVGAALLVSTLSASSTWAGVQALAVTGGVAPIPGVSNATYSSFSSYASVGSNSLFEAFVSNSSTYSAYADFCVDSNRVVSPLLVRGQLAPDAGGATFASGNVPTALPGGLVTFVPTLTGTGVNSNNFKGIYVGTPGNLHMLVRAGDPAPGAPGQTFSVYSMHNVRVSRSGDVAFDVQLSTAPASTAFGAWSTVGGLHEVARQLDPSPISGVTFGNLVGDPVVGNAGAAVITTLAGTGVTTDNDVAAFSDAGGTLHTVYREGDAAPGVPAYVYANITTSNVMSMNSGGQLAFASFLTRADKQPGVNYGLFLEQPGQGVHKLVVSGQAAPGTGGTFSQYSSIYNPEINESGQVVFRTVVTGGTSADVIYRVNADGTGLLPMFVDNVAAPGIGSGVTYTSFNDDYFNNRGQVATIASLSNFKHGLFATRADGTQALIAYEGQTLEILPGVFKTINMLSWPGSAGTMDSLPTLLDDDGRITFAASFTDSTSAILTSDTVFSPEPGALALLALGGLALVVRRR